MLWPTIRSRTAKEQNRTVRTVCLCPLPVTTNARFARGLYREFGSQETQLTS